MAFIYIFWTEEKASRVHQAAPSIEHTISWCWAHTCNHVCNNGITLSSQVFEGLHREHVLLPFASRPLLDVLQWSVASDWNPEKTCLLSDGLRSQAGRPLAHWLSIGQDHNIWLESGTSKHELTLSSLQSLGCKSTSLWPLESCNLLLNTCKIVGEVADCVDVASLLPIFLGCFACEALSVCAPCAWATVHDHRHLRINFFSSLECLHKLLGEGDLCVPPSLTNASTAINQKDCVDLCVQACKSCVVHGGLAPVLGTLSVFEAFWGPTIGALTSSSGSLDNISEALPGATTTIFGAGGPCSPCTQLAVHIACLGIALNLLLGVTTGSATILHWCKGASHSLLDTTATLRTALAPAAPRLLDTVNRASLIVAALELASWQALCSSVCSTSNTTSKVLLTTTALLCAFLWDPGAHGTVFEKCTVLAISLHLVELSTDLLQGTHLTFKLRIVVTASGHP